MPLLADPEAATPRESIVIQSLPPPALRGRAPTESPLAFTLHYTEVKGGHGGDDDTDDKRLRADHPGQRTTGGYLDHGTEN